MMPDANGRPTEPVTAEEFFEQALPLLPRVVKAAFRHNHPSASADDLARCLDRLRFILWHDDYQVLRNFRQAACLQTYLQRIANHEVVAFLKERKRDASLDDLTTEMTEQPPQQEVFVMHNEHKQMLEMAVKQLGTQDQELYNLYYREELSVEEIAERLGCKREAVWQRISRLRKRLEELIRKK